MEVTQNVNVAAILSKRMTIFLMDILPFAGHAKDVMTIMLVTNVGVLAQKMKCNTITAIGIALTACRMKIRLLANMLKTMATNHIRIF